LRTVKRNKRPVAYAFYDGVAELYDSDGNLTGEYEVSYTEPVKTLMNVSGGRGQADIALFGLTQTFARTAATEDLTTPFNTETVFWIETICESLSLVFEKFSQVGVCHQINVFIYVHILLVA
jgi:hypothetical protein